VSRHVRAFVLTALVALVATATIHLPALMGRPRTWPAFVHLALFGWITGMIYAVNYHAMPVFGGRDFPEPRISWLHVATFAGGILVAGVGILATQGAVTASGIALQLAAAIVFVGNIVLLFTRGIPRPHRPPPPAIAGQAELDRIGVRATVLSGLSLPLALALLLLRQLDLVSGSWHIAGEHLAATGWILFMIVGVAYHVLPRFSGRPTRGPGWARLQLACHAVAVVLMVLSLGFGWDRPFVLGALLLTSAVTLFAWTVWPTLASLAPAPTGPGQIPLAPK
jgi:hypothetical protein